MGAIALRAVTKRFGEAEVIRGVDLEIPEGSFAVFVGPSGCGKSTLLRLISGLEPVSGGRISIDGRDVTGVPPARRGLAMVFQSYALYPHMTVAENIGFGLRTKGVPKAERRVAVERAAEVLQLGPYLDRRPKALSGGQRQRVAIGRCIVRDPAAFLFDEPLSNLDAALQRRDAVGARRPAQAPRHDHDLRHPRPGRGDDAGRPDRGVARRRGDAGGQLRASSTSARPTASWRSSSAARA